MNEPQMPFPMSCGQRRLQEERSGVFGRKFNFQEYSVVWSSRFVLEVEILGTARELHVHCTRSEVDLFFGNLAAFCNYRRIGKAQASTTRNEYGDAEGRFCSSRQQHESS